MALERDQGGRLAKADPGGFDDLYRAEYPGMVRLAYVLTGYGDVAEDVVQDAFALLNSKFETLENPGGYLQVTVVNLCRNRQRRRRQDRRLDSRLQRPQLSSLGASEMADVLLRLPYRQRAVLVLRYWGGWSEAEIASALECRPGTVKTLASRGLERLRKEVAE
jgi:RNA polymerase sigma factor (sigma-70 family)